jgi:hypothetical protein
MIHQAYYAEENYTERHGVVATLKGAKSDASLVLIAFRRRA